MSAGSGGVSGLRVTRTWENFETGMCCRMFMLYVRDTVWRLPEGFEGEVLGGEEVVR